MSNANVSAWLTDLTAFLSELAHRDDDTGRKAEGLGQSLPEVRKLLSFCGWDRTANACVAADCRCKGNAGVTTPRVARLLTADERTRVWGEHLAKPLWQQDHLADVQREFARVNGIAVEGAAGVPVVDRPAWNHYGQSSSGIEPPDAYGVPVVDAVEQAREALRLCIVCLTTNYKATPGLWTSADADALAKATTALAAIGVKASVGEAACATISADLARRLLERLEYPGPSWIEHRAALAAELRAAVGVKGTAND